MKFSTLTRKLNGKKALMAVLVDPDKFNRTLVSLANRHGIDCFLVGGSRLENGDLKRTVRAIKSLTKIPVVLFPGDETQLSGQADGLLLLSLLSGRNPDYLIEKHIKAAPIIKKMKLPLLPTAYLLIGGTNKSTTQKITGTSPLDPNSGRYILNTALAAEQLGFKAIYLEAGSGADQPVSFSLIRLLKKNVSLPLIVGGGLTTPGLIEKAVRAGANMVVVGNVLEKDIHLLPSLREAVSKASKR
jgi:putative glycerol-1-phosphate prenyltransferase